MRMPSEYAREKLRGQTTIVTGASRGLGRAYATALADADANVVCVARTAADLQTTVDALVASGRAAIACAADVSTATGVQAIIKRTEEAYGPPGLLVNNAGLLGPLGPLYNNDPNEWWRCLKVNLAGPMRMMQAVLQACYDGGGRIINVVSGSGASATPHMSAYVTGKAALIRLTEIITLEVATSGVRVFAIDPGTVRTNMVEEAISSPSGK